MAKVIYCNKVNPSSECNHVIRGETEEEVLKQAAVHAREHGLEPTPELINKVRDSIEDEQSAAQA
jgi:predicted small metal-binding protein